MVILQANKNLQPRLAGDDSLFRHTNAVNAMKQRIQSLGFHASDLIGSSQKI